MQPVYIVGTGHTPVAEHWEHTALSLAAEALRGALGPIAPEHVGALYVANALGGAIGVQTQLGPAIAAAAGMRGIEAHTVEAGGASGGVALRQAYLAIAAGAYDLVAVVGVEKVTDVLDGRLEAGLALATDVDWEAVHGTTLTAQWAMLMRRYMHQYGYTAADFAPFPVNAHANGAANAAALYRFPINIDKVRAAAPVADPLVMLDCSTAADGAAVLLLAGERLARELPGPHIRVAGSAVATDSLALHSRPDPLWLGAAARSAAGALRAAELNVSDIDVLELTDPHGIAAALALEASGSRRARRGPSAGPRWRDRAGGSDAAGDRRWLQGPWRHDRRQRHLPGDRSGAAAARRGREGAGSRRARGAGAVPRRHRRDGSNSHFDRRIGQD